MSILKITANLRDALQRLRLRDRKRLLWVDAVCINQQDNFEKSKQIPAMAHIYSTAYRVLVWLGMSTRGQFALADIKKALPLRSRDSTNDNAQLSNLKNNFNNLVKLPWFSRRWVIQEVVLAGDVLVMCGPEEITLTRLFRVLNDLLRRSKVWSAVAPLAAMSTLSRTWGFEPSQDDGLRLFDLLTVFADSDCHVDLDKIYAVCGLASDCRVVDKKGEVQTNKISIVVDYSQTADCLYQSVVEQVLGLETNSEGFTKQVRGSYTVRAPDIDIYREVLGAVVERCDGLNRNAKAWVPDWRLPKKREPIFKSLDDNWQTDYRYSVYLGLVRPKEATQHDSLEVVKSVLEPFPDHPNMAEVTTWLQAMRDGLAYCQPHLRNDEFLFRQSSRSLGFLEENLFLKHDRTEMSPDCAWRAFLFIVLERGSWWKSMPDGRDAISDDALGLYLLSLGRTEVQVSSECWSFLCSLFRGRLIFFYTNDHVPGGTISGIGIGPDHLKAGAFFIVTFAEIFNKGRLSYQTLLWYTTAERVSAFVGDAWVYHFLDERGRLLIQKIHLDELRLCENGSASRRL